MATSGCSTLHDHNNHLGPSHRNTRTAPGTLAQSRTSGIAESALLHPSQQSESRQKPPTDDPASLSCEESRLILNATVRATGPALAGNWAATLLKLPRQC